MLRFVSKQLGMESDDATLDLMIQAADKDKDGTVSYREFVNQMYVENSAEKIIGKLSEEELSTKCDVKIPSSKKKTAALREQFALFDKDGDGTISTRELGSVLKSIGLEPEPHQLQRLIDIADTDRLIPGQGRE